MVAPDMGDYPSHMYSFMRNRKLPIPPIPIFLLGTINPPYLYLFLLLLLLLRLRCSQSIHFSSCKATKQNQREAVTVPSGLDRTVFQWLDLAEIWGFSLSSLKRELQRCFLLATIFHFIWFISSSNIFCIEWIF